MPVVMKFAHSVMFALPRITAPASRSRVTRKASCWAMQSRSANDSSPRAILSSHLEALLRSKTSFRVQTLIETSHPEARASIIPSMTSRIRVGTGGGLWELDRDQVSPVEVLTGKSLTALAVDGVRAWAIVDGRALWECVGSTWKERAMIEGSAATCVAPTPTGPLIGTEQAHLLRLTADGLTPVESFEAIDGRDAWYTPWGDPAGVRPIAAALDGTLHVNVHVGGVARSRDGGWSWAPTVDIESDVHQVLAHPSRADVVLAAAAEGLGVSQDGGDAWQFASTGLHAHYMRAVAVAGEHVLS